MRFKARIDKRISNNIAKKIADIKSPLTRSDANKLAGEVVREMKELIGSGYSPIKGSGISTRLAAYKNPKKYPGSRKAHTPVNLELYGDMLADLSASAKQAAGGGFVVEVGYSDSAQQVKEKGHRLGANSQPKRPTIPQAKTGETFANSIQSLYLDSFQAAIERIIRRGNS